MDGNKERDAVDEIIDALTELISQGESRMKVLDELSRHSKGELFVLRYLLEKNAAVVPTEIAEALGSSTSRVSAALGTLEKKGLIVREIDLSNRRNILVTITDEGRGRIARAMGQMRGHLRDVITEMGLEDAGDFLRLSKRFFEIAERTIGITKMQDCKQ